MKLLERGKMQTNVREITFAETILNNTMHRLLDKIEGKSALLTPQQYKMYKEYIKFLIDREFSIGSVSRPRNIFMPLGVKNSIDYAVKLAKQDYLRALKSK